MNLIFGRAYNDGIDFGVKNNYEKFYISAKKKSDNTIVTREDNTYVRNNENRILRFFFVLFLTAFLYLVATISKNIPISSNIIICAVLWIVLTSYFWINSKLKFNQKMHKYHAVEHKILNYYDKHNKVPTEVSDIVDEKSTIPFCGTILVTVLLIIATIVLITLALNVNFFLKVLFILTGILGTVALWINEKLLFFQKLTIAEPSMEELELGIEAMKFFLELKEAMRRQSP